MATIDQNTNQVIYTSSKGFVGADEFEYMVRDDNGDFSNVATVTVDVGGGILLGDVNGDGIVSLLDVQPFVELLTSGGFQPEADINQDGVVSLLDVDPFVGLLSGG